MTTSTTVYNEIREKNCVTCTEAWPADLDFFYSGGKTKDGLMRECKACYNATRRPAPQSRAGGALTAELQGLFSRLVQKEEHTALINQ